MKFLGIALLLLAGIAHAQTTYKDSMQQYINDYVSRHEVVKGDDKKQLQFFTIDETYKVKATFEYVKNAPWFALPTSSGKTKMYRQYGKLTFELNSQIQTLYVYQSQDLIQNPQYADHLFLPFTDATTGKESYETGRYIDLKIDDIKNNKVAIDFNKAYNPYCAYVSGYSCPIPPKENRLKIAIKAGEKKYRKVH
ncbi:MAG TPA: DUF1684 domain-containing protein [Niabella sp.]|nr:DUF1684 domain-containing protein [Niabella sp.]